MTAPVLLPVQLTPTAVDLVACEFCGDPIPADDNHEAFLDCTGRTWVCSMCAEDHDRACDHPGCRSD